MGARMRGNANVMLGQTPDELCGHVCHGWIFGSALYVMTVESALRFKRAPSPRSSELPRTSAIVAEVCSVPHGTTAGTV
jgi:hypothetical protein